MNDFVFVEQSEYNRIRKESDLQSSGWSEWGDSTTHIEIDSPYGSPQDYQTQVRYKWVTGQCEVPAEKERKVVVKLTLKEATYLEKRAEEDPKLKDILAKIEEQVDFELKVSFLTEEEE